MSSSDRDPFEEALALETKVKLNNDIDAMIRLGNLLITDRRLVSQQARGFQMLERAVKQGHHPCAMNCLAYHLLTSGMTECYSRAVSLLERSVKLQENPLFINMLGLCYRIGKGVAKDGDIARQLFQRALRLKQDPRIMGNLAIQLLETPKLHAQTERAIALYEKAIQLSSHPEMMNNLALMYHTGNGNLKRCPKKAEKWYSRAIRKHSYAPSMRKLAILRLENSPSCADIRRAVQLLEDAMDQEEEQHIETILRLADTYRGYRIDPDRALLLYEIAAIRFDSPDARCVLLGSWIGGVVGLRPDHVRILDFCLDDARKTGNYCSVVTAATMIWTGAEHIRRDRTVALKFLSSHGLSDQSFFTLLLRRDLSCFPGGRRSAQRLTKSYEKKIDRSNCGRMDAIILSENGGAEDKAVAMSHFRAQRANESIIAWLAPLLRMGRYRIPFDGHLDCITDPVTKFARGEHIASLNLASLLLEIEGMQQEAVTILEELMNSDLKLIASLNLAYVLMSDVEGVKQDRKRGMKLLEEVVKDTNDVSARAMLANALSGRSDSDRGAIERGWELWQGITRELEDEEELRKVGRLVSKISKERWREIFRQQPEEMRETCSSSATGLNCNEGFKH